MISPKDRNSNTRDKYWEQSIERHDLYNFESKIDYKIKKTSRKKTKYLIETYFFIPQTLQINKSSYTKDQFYVDLNNRIRFKTPQMTIDGLLDEKNELSPINMIMNKVKEIEFGNTSKKVQTRVEREIRLLACIIKVSLRDQFNYLFEKCRMLEKQCNLEDLMGSFLTSIKNLQKRMQKLRDKFLTVQIPYRLREAFDFASDYISLQIDVWVTKALKRLKSKLDIKLRNQMITIIEKEQSFRKSLHSRVIIKEDSKNESVSYWESILKKYVQGVLYLDKKIKDPKSSSLEILYSVAAGFAMFMSLFLGFLILSNFVEDSIPFLVGAVVIYMLKDRIKDNVRAASKRAIGLFFPDQREEIIDEFYNEQIGESKEKVAYLKWDDVAPEIIRIRSSTNKSPLEEKGKPEIVISYRQQVTLFNEKIEEIHTRKQSLSNIIRFNIREFLRYADDPIEYISYWNMNKREIESVPISKVYHLNIVLKMTIFKGRKVKKVVFKKFRVILDQKGIKRVVEPDFSL